MAEISTLLTVRQIKALDRDGGDVFTGILLLKRVTSRTAKNGNTFLNIELGDKTGSFNANIFSDSQPYQLIENVTEGTILRVEGRIDYFQDRLSPKISRADEVGLDRVSPEALANLVETAPEDANALWAELQQHAGAIAHPEIRATVQAVFEEIGEQFRTAPAAIAMHHAYRHGLLEHTVHIARAARAILPLYPEVDPDLAIAGILLHDTGKVIEYQGNLVTTRSRKGILHGHVVLGYQLARKAGIKAKLAPDLLERLEHIILSHQGELEWGAAVMAATPEAVFVAKLDDLDAKMGMVQRLLRQAGEDDEFSDKHPGLNSQLLLRKPAKSLPSP